MLVERASPGPVLVLVGHGSRRNPQARVPTERLAARLREEGGFAAVHAAFWKEAPSLAEVFAALRIGGDPPPPVMVVPNFAGEGYFTRELIPAEVAALDYPGPVTVFPPVGAHPRMEDILRRRTAEALAADARLSGGDAPTEAALLLVGHGSRRPGGSGDTARALAKRLHQGCGCRVLACFLEEDPPVSAWPDLLSAHGVGDDRPVVVLPLLIAEGLHGSEDLPPLFGLAPEAVADGAPPLIGPTHMHGRRIWYWRGIGSDPEVAAIVRLLTGVCPA